MKAPREIGGVLPLCLSAALGSSATLSAQSDITFATDVWPFLEAKCIRCHQAPTMSADGKLEEPEGGLRLDGKAWILRGGDGEDAVVGGDLEASGIHRRVSLPSDDADFMPPKGDALTDAERDVLRRWIESGADFGDWVGSAADPATEIAPTARTERQLAMALVPPRVARWQQLAEGLTPLGAPTIERAAGLADDGKAFAQIRPVIDDGPLLRVTFRAREPLVDDRAIARVVAIGTHIVELDLARTQITDAALAQIAKLPRLTRLDLPATQVGDAGVARLARSPELRTLNLWGTKVSDRGVLELAKSKTLEKLYLWDTAVTEAGIAALQALRPDLEIVARPEWPAAPAAEPERRQRRR